MGFVSYGGISGGLRAAQMVKQTVGGVKMVPIAEAVSIPFVGQAIDKESGTFKATDAQDKSAATHARRTGPLDHGAGHPARVGFVLE